MSPIDEQTFASCLDEVGDGLMAAPEWRDLLVYRGVSAWEAGHWSLYYGFLDALRSATGGGGPPAWDGRGRAWPGRARLLWRSVRDGGVPLRDVPRSIAHRLLYRARMSMPARPFPRGRGSPRALMLEAFANNLSTLLPVALVLRRGLGWDVLFTGWGSKLGSPVREAGVPFAGIQELFRRRLLALEARHRRGAVLALDGLDVYRPGEVLAELSGVPLRFDARGLLLQLCALVRMFTDVYMEMLERYEPHVVVLANEHSPPGRTMACAAASAGVPSVALQHGLYAERPVYRRLSTGKLLVWGEHSRESWLERGCSLGRVLVTGAVRYDAGERPVEREAKGARSSADTPTVLVAWQSPGSELSRAQHEASLRALLAAAARLPQVRFVFKAHPGERPGRYNRALAAARLDNVRLVTEGPIQPLIDACDLLVTFFSTTAIEAMASGRPVLVLHLSPEPPLAPYARAGAAALVTDRSELAGAIARLLEDEAAREALVEGGRSFVRDYLGPLDGQSARRAAEAIAEMTADRIVNTGEDVSHPRPDVANTVA